MEKAGLCSCVVKVNLALWVRSHNRFPRNTVIDMNTASMERLWRMSRYPGCKYGCWVFGGALISVEIGFAHLARQPSDRPDSALSVVCSNHA